MKIGCFVPEKKGRPGCIKVFKFPEMESLVSKSFFKSQQAQMFWNCHGSALLVLSSTDSDKSGTTYYGETAIVFISLNSKNDINLTLSKKLQFVFISLNSKTDINFTLTFFFFSFFFSFLQSKIGFFIY